MPTRAWNTGDLVAVLSFAGLGFLAWVAGRKVEPAAEPEPDDPEAPTTVPPGPVLDEDKATLADAGDLAQLDAQLVALGVTDFTARDLTANRKAGQRVHFMPPLKFMGNLLAVAQLAQGIRDAWGDELVVSSAYRPQDGPKSRHFTAKAIDLDLPSGQRTTANRDAFYLFMAQRYLATSKAGRKGFGGMGFYTQPKGRLHVDVRDRPTYWTAAIVEPFFARVRQA